MSLYWVKSNNFLKYSFPLFRYIKLAIFISFKVSFSELKYYIKVIVFTYNIIIIKYCRLSLQHNSESIIVLVALNSNLIITVIKDL